MADLQTRMSGVKPSDLLEKCKQFLGSGWSQVNDDNFQFRVLTAGFGNRLFVCGTKDDSVTASPRQVLVRLYGGNVLPKDIPFRVLTEASECVVFYAVSERGWGPQLFGVFDGGRIEEFVSSRLFTIDEFCDDPEISAAMARSMARYHTLDLPVPRPQTSQAALLRDIHEKHVQKVKDGLPPLPPTVSDQHAKATAALINFDLTAEADWLEKIEQKISRRLVFSHGDVNRGNSLLRLNETSDDGRRLTWDERILLIDYEFSSYDFRGTDIGNHFGMQVHDFGQEQWLMHKEFPSESRRRAFIQAYVDECKRLNAFDNWEEDGRDSVDNILLESDLGVLVSRIVTIAWAQWDIEGFCKMQDGRRDVDPEFTEPGGLASFVFWYQEMKQNFLERYPNLA